MNIISGKYKGRKINIASGIEFKPTKNITKNAIFDILHDKMIGATVADLYAGSGALGLEALSRGAKKVYFVDNNEKMAAAIQKTIHDFGEQINTVISKTGSLKFLDEIPANIFDIIFLDPPYENTSTTHLLNLCGECIKNNGVVVFEHSGRFAPKTEYDTLMAVNQRKYGNSTVTFFAKKTKAAKEA